MADGEKPIVEKDKEQQRKRLKRVAPNGSVIHNVPQFVSKLNDVMCLAEKDVSQDSPLLEVCKDLRHTGEALAVSMDKEFRRRLSIQEQCHATSDAFHLSLQRLVYLNSVCQDLQQKVSQQQQQIDKAESSKRRRLKPAQLKELKNPSVSGVGAPASFSSVSPQSSQTLPSRGSVNTYGDFQKNVMPGLICSSLPNQVGPASGVASTRVMGSVRKARSETDLRESELEKELKSVHVDNTRLRDSEKKFRKDNSQLQRKCKTLEKERDKAEDRLQVEQSNRDSLSKLRKRNKELESQLNILCQEEVWKKTHQNITDILQFSDVASDQASGKVPTDGNQESKISVDLTVNGDSPSQPPSSH